MRSVDISGCVWPSLMGIKDLGFDQGAAGIVFILLSLHLAR